MPEETPNIVLEHLRAIRAELHEVREEQREQRISLGAIERNTANMASELPQMGPGLDRMHGRIDRIERRLGLVEA